MPQHPPRKSPSSSSSSSPGRRRRAAVIAASAAAVLAVGGGAWAWRSSLPPAADGDPVAVARYVATDAFDELPAGEQKPYREALSATFRDDRTALDALSDDERRAAARAIRGGGMADRADAYFALKTQPEREKYLAEMSARRGNWGGNRGDRPGGRSAGRVDDRGPGGERRGPNARRDPVQKAKAAEFIATMRRQREAEGGRRS